MIFRFTVSASLFLLAMTSGLAKDNVFDLIVDRRPAVVDDALVRQPHAEQAVGALSDGDTTRAVEFAADNQPIEIVYDFGEQIVSPSGLVLHWVPTAKSKKAPSIEMLGSTLSFNAGFQTLRTAHLQSRTGKQTFSFVPRTARWVMVRIIPADNGEHVSLAELSIRGAVGPPESIYDFKESPADAFDVLSKLKGMIELKLSADEKSLFEDAKDGKLNDWKLAEGVLIASGVTEKQERTPLLDKIDSHEAIMQTRLQGSLSAFDKGRLLLQYLHTPPTLVEYESRQTDVHTLLNTGKFNCVSSAAIYNVLARRLGLDARTIEVPDHAFSILYDGTRHADVEATNGNGFNPTRNPAALATLQRQTGFTYIAGKHPDQRREIGETGLIGLIYYNHGVGHSDNKEYGRALFRYFCALSMDSEYDSAVKNTLVTLANWGASLAEEKKYVKALSVLNAGVELAPNDARLRAFRENVWKNRVFDLMDANQSEQAIAILREAHQKIPDSGFDEMQAWVFVRPAQAMVKEKRWLKAINLADSGRDAVDPPAQEELTKWISNVYLNWSVAAIREKQFEEAADALRRGLQRFPKDYRLQRNVAYLTQEWSKQLIEHGKDQEATKMMTNFAQLYPDNWHLKQVAVGSVSRQISESLKKGETDAAIKLIDQNQTALSGQDFLKLKRRAYDLHANKFIEAKNWRSAVSAYKDALDSLPNDYHLKNNLFAVYSNWCQEHIKAKNWNEAAIVCRQAIQDTNDFRLKKNHAYIVQEWLEAESDHGPESVNKVARDQIVSNPNSREIHEVVANSYARQIKKLLGEEKYDEAIVVGQHSVKAFSGVESRRIERQFQHVYAVWAKTFTDKSQWKQAGEIYEQGLKQFPAHRDFVNNLTVCWERRVKAFTDKEDWDAAVELLEKAVKRFPKSYKFRNNLRFCKEQSK